jgi:hypothetical protein
MNSSGLNQPESTTHDLAACDCELAQMASWVGLVGPVHDHHRPGWHMPVRHVMRMPKTVFALRPPTVVRLPHPR